jgi:hypothetical protein
MEKRKQTGDVGGNRPRGLVGDLPDVGEAGESGGPAGIERSGGPQPLPPRNGVPEGMTPGDLQISPEEKIEEWTRED